jgi:hypothetical protein
MRNHHVTKYYTNHRIWADFFAASQAMENLPEMYNVECKEPLWERATDNSKRTSTAQIRYSGRSNWTSVEVNQKTITEQAA